MQAIRPLILFGLSAFFLATFAFSNTISVNLGISLNDANSVDTGETSTVGIDSGLSTDGSVWNNALLRATGAGSPTNFTTATQGGSHIDLNDSSGTDSGVNMTSSGSFYANFSNASGSNAGTTGDGGMMQSFILANSSETTSLSGLSTWAPNGYQVYVYFDIGAVNRTYGLTANDGTNSYSYFSNDTSGADSDSNNDGVINWIQTTATTSGSAVADANYAVFGTFTGDTLTISGADSNRAPICGFQIVALSDPPATIHSFTVTPPTFVAGQTVTLNWNVSDADSVSINQGIGPVSNTGSTTASPSNTTTWTLSATRGSVTITQQVTATFSKGPIHVYLLSGQSNMQGIALSSKLPTDFLNIPEIMLYAGGTGVPSNLANQWINLQPANGSTFGPEIGFGERLRDFCPGQNIALIKYAASGNSLEINFKPGANAADTANWGGSFTGMVNTFNNGIAALEADGWQPVIQGMCWQQGEQDAKDGLNVPESNTSADDYGANLSHFIDRIREQFAAHASPDGIRFVLGQVLPYAPAGGDVEARFPGRDLVRQAELDLDENSGAALSKSNTATVPTNSTDHPTLGQVIDGYRDTDEVHLGATAQLNLGKSMAYKMLHLSPQTYAEWSATHGLTGGQTDDDDLDGLDNLTEFYLGNDPLDSMSHSKPIGSIEEIDGQNYLTINYTRNLNALSASATVQVSEDLVNWNNGVAPVFIESTKNGNGNTTLKYRAPWHLSDPAHPRIFLRLHITP